MNKHKIKGWMTDKWRNLWNITDEWIDRTDGWMYKYRIKGRIMVKYIYIYIYIYKKNIYIYIY